MTLNAKGGSGRIDGESETFVAHALRADGFDASEYGTGRGTPLVPHCFDARQSDVIQYGDHAGPLDTDGSSQAICFTAKDNGGDAEFNLSPTLRAGGFTTSHANAGVMPAVAIPILEAGARTGRSTNDTACGIGIGEDGDPMFSLQSSKQHAVATRVAVRRLMPIECERLMGFPDGYTLIPYRGKLAADGPRYKALGNSMAVNVMRWIGRRIKLIDGLASR